MTEYYEKVKNPPSNIANGAIFAFDYSFLKCFLDFQENLDNFCADIVPLLKGKVQTYFTNCLFIDIGTPKSLKLAKDLTEKNNG